MNKHIHSTHKQAHSYNAHDQQAHDHSTEDTATGVIAGLAIILCCILGILLWAEQEPMPRVTLAAPDTVVIEGFGAYPPRSLDTAGVFTGKERLHVMRRSAELLHAYQMGYRDARGLQPTDQDMLWLSRIIYTEARGQSYRAQLYVATVAVNRMESERYPNTMQEVALDYKQFSAFNDRSAGALWRHVDLQTHNRWWRQSMRAAYAALTMPPDLRPLSQEVMHFYSPGAMEPRYRVPNWARGQQPVVDLGEDFKFYADIS